MRFASVCSGIECASIAFAPLGWEATFFAEIDPFAATVLHHHHSSGRPRHMPSPNVDGLTPKDRRARTAAIKAVAALPERANGVPNHGDMTTFEEWPDAAFDLLIGGTPCQTYSVAGLRKGLDDPRGDLTLTFAAIARRFRPRWVAWENVFGVLSHDGGRSFASLLGLLSGRRVEVPAGGWKSAGIVEGYGRAYGLAWRVLDTQYVRVDGFGRAIPQRRRRVFVVGYLGDWRRAAAVLLEREGLSGNPAPRRRSGQDVAGTVAGGARSRGGYSADDIPLTAEAFGGGRTGGAVDVAACLTAKGQRIDFEVETFVATLTRGAESAGSGGYAGRRQEDDVNLVTSGPVAPPLTGNPYGDHESWEDLLVAHTLRADGFDASEDCTGRGTPLVPISVAIRGRDGGGTIEAGDDVAHTIRAAQGGDKPHVLAPVAYALRNDAARSGEAKTPSPDAAGKVRLRDAGFNVYTDVAPTLDTGQAHSVAYGIDSDCLDRSGEGAGGTAGERSGLGITEEHTNALRAKRPGAVATGWAVRRLTPRECCRLQGVLPGYFDEVVWRGKIGPPDGPIYKTLGNGFSANAVRWIGRRIEMVEALELDALEAAE